MYELSDGAGGYLVELLEYCAATEQQRTQHVKHLDDMIAARQELHRNAIAAGRGMQTVDVVRASSEMSALMLYRSQTYSAAVQNKAGV